MAITVGQIPGMLQTVEVLTGKLGDMRMLLNQAKELSEKGWQVDIGSRLPILVTITPAQRQALIDHYETIKAQLATEFQKLP